jgi:hypothetical protein
MKGRLWGWASLFMEARLGNLEWACLPGILRDGRKGLWKWGISLYGSSVNGTLLGTLENREKRLWRWASVSIGVPLGNLERYLSTRSLRDRCREL